MKKLLTLLVLLTTVVVNAQTCNNKNQINTEDFNKISKKCVNDKKKRKSDVIALATFRKERRRLGKTQRLTIKDKYKRRK